MKSIVLVEEITSVVKHIIALLWHEMNCLDVENN